MNISLLYDGLKIRVLDRLRDPVLLLLRLVVGYDFFITGWGKLHNIPHVVEFFTSLGIPMPELNARFVSGLETVGGLLLLLGLASRLIAIPLSINMLVAYITADRAAFADVDAFTSAAEFPFLAVSLIVLAFGPGLFSLDALIARLRKPRPDLRMAAGATAMLLLFVTLPARGAAPPAHVETAVFSMGCFWCGEEAFEHVPGVIKSVSGYTGGTVSNPTYEQVSDGGTGHRESVQVTFDPTRITYAKVLDIFWHNVDPQDRYGQFCDKGDQYKSAIYYQGETQRTEATASYQAVQKRFGTIYTELHPAPRFWPAEDYHQDYAEKNPVRYKFYRFNCGRDARLKELWGGK